VLTAQLRGLCAQHSHALQQGSELSVSEIVPHATGEQQWSIGWHKGRVLFCEVFRNEEIVLEQMDKDVHLVFFFNTELRDFNTLETRFRPALGHNCSLVVRAVVLRLLSCGRARAESLLERIQEFIRT
jgi:hypothetical protein